MAAMNFFIFSVLIDLWRRLVESRFEFADKIAGGEYSTSIRLERLAKPSKSASLPKLKYAYDPLPALPANTKQRLRSLPSGALAKNSSMFHNSVLLDPLVAGLPYRCSIDHVYASRFWELNLAETKDLLGLLAIEDSPADIVVDHGITLAKLAREALRPGIEHQIVLAAYYMFPAADEVRMKQLTALMIIYFVFDGSFTLAPRFA